jgi:hypothetical protein
MSKWRAVYPERGTYGSGASIRKPVAAMRQGAGCLAYLYRFLKECLAHEVADLASHASLTLSEKLQGFKDLVVYDGSIIKLHDMLAEKFPGARHKAELKIRLWRTALTDG